MPPPKHPPPDIPPHLLAELLALQPYIEHLLCDGSREPHVRAAAKDDVQTVLRKAIQHLPSYQPHKDGLRPWVTRIALNEKINVYRSAQHFDDTFGHDRIPPDRAPDSDSSPEHEAQVRALLDKVIAHIEEMPPDMRNVLILAANCEDSKEEIAAHLGIRKGAATMRLSRARKMLRKRAGSIRDHVGVLVLVFLRKLAASRVPLLTRVRTFLWQTAHLLPPIYIGLVASPELEPTGAAPAEYAVVAPPRDEPSLDVRDNRPPVDVAVASRPVVKGSAPNKSPSTNVHASDKPRRRMQSRQDFNVVLPPPSTILSDGR